MNPLEATQQERQNTERLAQVSQQYESEIHQLKHHIAYMALEWTKTFEELTKLQKQIEAAKTIIKDYKFAYPLLCDKLLEVLGGETTK